MNPNETSPSFSLEAIRTTEPEPEPVGVGNIPNVEPSTDNNQGPSFTNVYPDQGKSINEPFKGDSYGYEEKAPSLGALRQFVPSNPSGSTTYQYSDNQPPSLNDVARRNASQTGSSYTGNEYEGSVPQPGMSLTGKNFNKYHPGAFHKDI